MLTREMLAMASSTTNRNRNPVSTEDMGSGRRGRKMRRGVEWGWGPASRSQDSNSNVVSLVGKGCIAKAVLLTKTLRKVNGTGTETQLSDYTTPSPTLVGWRRGVEEGGGVELKDLGGEVRKGDCCLGEGEEGAFQWFNMYTGLYSDFFQMGNTLWKIYIFFFLLWYFLGNVKYF